MTQFIETSPTLDAYWRAIILFGRNSASYKFALAKSLLEIATEDNAFVSLDDLAKPFSKHITQHLQLSERQGTSKSSSFLEECRRFNNDEIDQDQLYESTVRLGFANVIDAFHIVNQGEIPIRFYIDERNSRGGITVTDDLFLLKDDPQFINLPDEVEARWRLVETAWSFQFHPQLLIVEHDTELQQLFVPGQLNERIDVTSSRDALNGYQKGKCFYCFSNITIDQSNESAADVDHFFPHILKPHLSTDRVNIDGVWNLVLTCFSCNRGPQGKFARVPRLKYLERLNRRNNYLIDSHHPLKQTLIAQTGTTPKDRRAFLQTMHRYSVNTLIHQWSPPNEGPATF